MNDHRPSMSGVFDIFRSKKTPAAPPQPSIPPMPLPRFDIYLMLGIRPDASLEEIRRNFKELAAKFHPDRNEGDPIAARRFQEINEAYQVASDPARREAYDRARAATKPASQAPPPPMPTAGSYPSVVPEQSVPPRAAPAAPGAPSSSPGAPKGKGPKPATVWETMFGPETPEEPAKGSFFNQFQPSRPGSPIQYPPGFAPRNVERPIAIPTVREIIDFFSHWPLDQIWDVARAERTRPGFQAVVIDIVAGTGGYPEIELAELFGLDPEGVASRLQEGDRGKERLWREVFEPLFYRFSEAMNAMKPEDLPGDFYLTFDQSGRFVELVYQER